MKLLATSILLTLVFACSAQAAPNAIPTPMARDAYIVMEERDTTNIGFGSALTGATIVFGSDTINNPGTYTSTGSSSSLSSTSSVSTTSSASSSSSESSPSSSPSATDGAISLALGSQTLLGCVGGAIVGAFIL